MALHNEGHWWMNTWPRARSASDYVSYNNHRVVWCHSDHRPNVISLLYNNFTCQSNNISFNVTLLFHCLLLALCDGGPSGVLNRVHAQRLCVLPSSQNFAIRERCHAQLKNEIMNGNQGDYVTFVWTWRRSKQRFCCTFHQFIQHHDAAGVHGRKLRNPNVTLLKQAG